MRLSSIIILSILVTFSLHAQSPISVIESFLEVHHPSDTTSTYIGVNAGQELSGGSRNNTFVGYQSGVNSTSGASNTFYGSNAGFNTNGFRNCFVGASSGANTSTGNNNICIGVSSGLFNSSGSNNCFVGDESGRINGTGSGNTYLGTSSGGNIANGMGNVCIGNNAGPTTSQSDRLYIDNTTTDNPLIFGRFDTDVVAINGSLQLGPTDHFNGDDALLLGPSIPGADIFLVANDAVIIEIGDIPNQSGNFQVWNGGLINTDPDRIIFDLTETGNLEISGTLSQGSDLHSKERITHIDNMDILNKIVNLPISEWQYIDENIRHIGPMAQDFYAAFGLGLGETTIATVDADGVALAAIKALALENKVIKEENRKLQKTITDILERLNALEEKG